MICSSVTKTIFRLLFMNTDGHVVGINNRSAPNMYRTYNCFDHLFPYEPKQIDTDQGSAKLIAALERFASLLAHKIGVPPWDSTNDAHVDAYNKVAKNEKSLYRMLIASPDAREVTVNPSNEGAQIYLCRNYLIELSDNIGCLGRISSFQACCNYLRYIPSGIGHLRHLKMLTLSRNRLIELPDEIGMCKELREIDVSFNLLKKLPRSIAGLQFLNSLHLTGNRFTTLPSFFGKLKALKYLNIGHNPITRIPLEVFKLPFLLTLSSDNCPFITTQRFEEVGSLTLTEIAARTIIKNNLSISRKITVPLRNFILSVQECSFCSGPFFDYYIEVEDIHQFETAYYPVHYRMCSKHYTKHEDRLRILFEANLDTVPIRLQKENMPSVTELFEPYCFDEAQTSAMKEAYEDNGPVMPLIGLAKYNTQEYKAVDVTALVSESVGNLNILDT